MIIIYVAVVFMYNKNYNKEIAAGQELFNYDNTNLEEVIQHFLKNQPKISQIFLKEYDEAEYKTYEGYQKQEANVSMRKRLSHLQWDSGW